MSPRTPPHIVSFAIPAIEPQQAEALMDLLGQLQAALWDAYGEAILAAEDDPLQDIDQDDDKPTSDPGDASPF
jgi:hypothetical protein